MLRWILLMSILSVGCTAPTTTNSVENKNGLSSKNRQLLDAYLSSLQSKDWEALSELHWSGSEMTVDSLKELYQPMLERIGGADKIVDDVSFTAMSSENYTQFMDEDELPGPAELLRGEIEFTVSGGDSSQALVLWTHLCEENGKAKFFDYIEVFVE